MVKEGLDYAKAAILCPKVGRDTGWTAKASEKCSSILYHDECSRYTHSEIIIHKKYRKDTSGAIKLQFCICVTVNILGRTNRGTTACLDCVLYCCTVYRVGWSYIHVVKLDIGR